MIFPIYNVLRKGLPQYTSKGSICFMEQLCRNQEHTNSTTGDYMRYQRIELTDSLKLSHTTNSFTEASVTFQLTVCTCNSRPNVRVLRFCCGGSLLWKPQLHQSLCVWCPCEGTGRKGSGSGRYRRIGREVRKVQTREGLRGE